MQKFQLIDEEGNIVAVQVSSEYLDRIEKESKILQAARELRGPQDYLSKEELIRYYFDEKDRSPIKPQHLKTLKEVSDVLSLSSDCSGHLYYLTTNLQWLTIVVTLKWDELSEYDREQLAIFAYQAIEGQPSFQRLCSRVVGMVRILRLLLSDNADFFASYILNHKQLISAILNQIERSNPEYQAMLGKAVLEAFQEEAGNTKKG